MHPLEEILVETTTHGDRVSLADKYSSAKPSGVKSLPSLEVQQERTDGLSGVPPPPLELKKENNAHRIMLYLAAAGNNISEIAGITGYTPQHVSTITRQDWFQTQLARLLEESGKPVIDQLLQSEAKNSLNVLLALRDSDKTPASVRSQCAFNILDRVLGKPTQKTESINHNFNRTSTMTMTEIEAEEERLKLEELRLRGA